MTVQCRGCGCDIEQAPRGRSKWCAECRVAALKVPCVGCGAPVRKHGRGTGLCRACSVAGQDFSKRPQSVRRREEEESVGLPPRIADKLDVTGIGCWEWRGGTTAGYGVTTWGGKAVKAHRLVWERLVGPIADGLQIDHLCRNTVCCNPDHLEPVSAKANTLRGYSVAAINSRKTHCARGHAYTPENTRRASNGGRVCKACAAVDSARWNCARKEATA